MFKINKGVMSVEDYKALYEAISHMSCDIESEVECPYGFEGKKLVAAECSEETLEKYAYVSMMLDCINDVPKSRLEGAIEAGVELPEIDW